MPTLARQAWPALPQLCRRTHRHVLTSRNKGHDATATLTNTRHDKLRMVSAAPWRPWLGRRRGGVEAVVSAAAAFESP